jgi:predicted ArsR family transcriptional regulator
MKPPLNVATRRNQIKMGAVLYARMIEMMLHGTFSCREMADETGLHYVTVLQYTRELYRAGASHIAHWEKDKRGRDITKIYKIGNAKDKPRQRMTKAERTARYRDKLRAIKEANIFSETA